ncbi:unnamed protein product, partial [Soboliphyme baturini]|uniref:EF-hand_2 domain-containing protein n=1 Tax=Soboliphyme baturini TaxID=241478 RepID=A0A183IS24_9BILA
RSWSGSGGGGHKNQLNHKGRLSQPDCGIAFVLGEQNFDTIRFATYRTACKLRFMQKIHLVDIWNVIESFRENGLNTVDYKAEVKLSRIELLLSTVYHNLNKRLPVSQQIDSDRTIALLVNFLSALAAGAALRLLPLVPSSYLDRRPDVPLTDDRFRSCYCIRLFLVPFRYAGHLHTATLCSSNKINYRLQRRLL